MLSCLVHDLLPASHPATPSDSSSLPPWTRIALSMIVDALDQENKQCLNTNELAQLQHALQASNPHILVLSGELDETRMLTVDGLERFYTRLGEVQLLVDLRALDIHFGTTPELASQVSECAGQLSMAVQEMETLRNQVTNLHVEVDDKSRTARRLQEGLAEAQASLNNKTAEIQQSQTQRDRADKSCQSAQSQVATLTSELTSAQQELAAAKAAIVDLRSLTEQQVTEKERWQRYCWELETRLQQAESTGRAKEADLWKTRDAQREEARRNRLLYMQSQSGKRHYDSSNIDQVEASPIAASAPPPPTSFTDIY